VFNGALYFQAGDGTHGRELWRTDGTTAGTALVKDINPGAGDGFYCFYGAPCE
jgi:ELWxxDGT repeat protein